MILVTGGAGQGKLAWALGHSGYPADRASPRLSDDSPILCRLEEIVRETLRRGENPEALLPALLRKEYVLCREVGCGVVPLSPEERRWREEVGRLCCRLAREADGVVRLWCGIPDWLKGGDS